MKKYYIPTSSLNFNNILSSESISPKCFYAQRGFGYARWTEVEENCIPEVTLLYDTAHHFERPKSDVEDHAMLLEITTEEDFPLLQKGVYYTPKTIYLNPWETKFYFFSNQIKTTALSLSQNSLETKMTRLYERKIEVRRFEGKFPDLTVPLSKAQIDTEKYIAEEFQLNKMKGLLYGFYIGANLSTTREQVKQLVALREIQNIFSSVLSSYDRQFSEPQRVRLEELFSTMEQQQPFLLGLEQIEPDAEKRQAILESHKKYFPSSELIRLILLLLEHAPDTALEWVKGQLQKLHSYSRRPQLSPDEGRIIVSSEKLESQKVLGDKLPNQMFLMWVNTVLSSSQYNGRINTIRENLSDELTMKAKEVIGADWEGSPIRGFLNQLRHAVRGEEFPLDWNNGLISSISAVLLKGNDWENLLLFMQSKEMTDYALAFGIYGLLNGFANLTRDFTDLLLNEDSHYLAVVYREFYGQLHGKTISSSPIDVSRIPRSVPVPTLVPSSSAASSSKNSSLKEFCNRIRSEAEQCMKKDKEKLRKSLENALKQNGENTNYVNFLALLNNYPGWKTAHGPSEAWKRLQVRLVPNYDEIFSNKTIHTSAKSTLAAEPSFFDPPYAQQATSHFYNDDEVQVVLREMIGVDKCKEIQWFFDDMRKPRAKRDYYQKVDEQNNRKVIGSFFNSKKVQDALGNKLEEVRSFLNEKYGIRENHHHDR